MRSFMMVVGAALSLSIFAVPGHAQTYPLFWVAPANFEQGVPLSKSTAVGRVTIGCTVDNYSHKVDWGDGTSNVLTTPGAAHQITHAGATRTVVDPNTYSLYADADKTYGAAVSGNPALPAKISSTLHCLDGTSTGYWTVSQSIHVYPHIPLKQITATPASVKGGTNVTIAIASTTPAPPSNARVNLQWSGPGASLVLSPAASLDLPYTLDSVSQVFSTTKTRTTKTVTITANSGVGGTVRVSFQIVP